MRVLLLFRGAPGCGKSTYIDQHGLRSYTLSADEIRLQCQSAQQTATGEEAVALNNENTTWSILFKLLEVRMKNGEFTVIDATNSKTSEMNKYKQMAQDYRYRVYLIDMTDLPIEECKRRNAQRPSLKRVPEAAIDKMYARFETQKVPSAIKVIKPDELETIWMHKIDLSSYRKIVHIGDIHGCGTALRDYFEAFPMEDDVYYIFCGDYIDRGVENAETLEFLFSIYNKPNVLMLEGNHERWLWIYAHGGTAQSKEFELVTRKQLEAAHIDPKFCRMFYRKLAQCAWYDYNGKEVFVSHGGIATMPNNLTMLSTEQMIKGVGGYNDYEVAMDTWMNTTSDNQYQIFGHRNVKNLPIKARDRIFDLEGQIEFGGDLRVVELDKDGFHEVYTKNTVFKDPEIAEETDSLMNTSIAQAVVELRGNKYIQEKNFGNISSFNFTREAFFGHKWDEQTTTARGLYIDVNKYKVVARGFNKFFNINERPETKFDMLQYSFKFPVTAYVKENGFLGLVSYDEYNDDLFVTTKSSPIGNFSDWLRDMIDKKISKDNRDKIKDYCKENNVTFIFECVDMEHDPHVIEYPQSGLYLLAIVKNQMTYEQLPYDKLVEVGKSFGLSVKTKAYVINNWSEFFDWYNEVTQEGYTFDGRIIEGFVIEDSKGFMTKIKLYYYNYWKHLRSVADRTIRYGNIRDTGSLVDDTSNRFYAFCRKLHDDNVVVGDKVATKEALARIPKSIVVLRRMFESQKNEVFNEDNTNR